MKFTERHARVYGKDCLACNRSVKNKNAPSLIGGPQTQIREQFFFKVGRSRSVGSEINISRY